MVDDLVADSEPQSGEPSLRDVATQLPAHKAGGDGALSIAEAARSLADWRAKQEAQANSQHERSEPSEGRSSPPPAEPPSAAEADANPEAGHGEQTPEAVEAETPPIDPPVSWTTAEKERWQSIPRETQEYIAQRETEREKLLTKSRTEAADQLKGLQAREQAMEQARLQFEQMTQVALQGLQQQLQGEFGDIKSMDDAKALAVNDWARYLRWDAHQKDLSAKMAAMQQAQARQQQEHVDRFARFAQEQDKLFIEKNPEFADPEKAAKMQGAAVSALRDVGFSEDELGALWNGQMMMSLRDGRVQSLIADGVRYRQGQSAAKKVVASKALPPVQRPGVAQSGHVGLDDKIRSLQRQLDRSSGNSAINIAMELHNLQRQRETQRGGRS